MYCLRRFMQIYQQRLCSNNLGCAKDDRIVPKSKIGMFKHGCIQANLANVCLHQSVFVAFCEGIEFCEDLMEEQHKDMLVARSLHLREKPFRTRLLFLTH